MAVTNSSCIIALERIGHLNLLPGLFTEICAPPAVIAELGLAVPWLAEHPLARQDVAASLRTQVGHGEAEALALALEFGDREVILDDRQARRIGRELGLRVVGTLGVLVRAKRAGVVTAVTPLLDELAAAGFHATESLRREALRLSGE